jgi:hypothetical protein
MTDPATSKPRQRMKRAHPLLRPFPLAVQALAAFLTVFALLMANLQSNPSPAALASTHSTVIVHGRRLTVTTTASGRRVTSPTAAKAERAGGAGAVPAVVTAASGSGAGDD